MKTSLKKYQFKAPDNLYYGIVFCLGEPIVMRTINEGEAIVHFDDEMDDIISILLSQGIFADPIEVK